MKIVLIILACVCCAQADSVQDAANTAVATITSLANQVGQAIQQGRDLLAKYSDNSTNYVNDFNVNVITEIKNVISGLNQSIIEASAVVNASHANALACFEAKRQEVLQLGINVATEIGKCFVTKVKQFSDLLFDLVNYANKTIFLVPNASTKIQDCQKLFGDFLKFTCTTVTCAEAVAILAEVAIGVSATVAKGTALYGTIQADLSLCAVAKLFGFRQTVIEIGAMLALCTAQSIISG